MPAAQQEYLLTYLAFLDPDAAGAARPLPRASCGRPWPATASRSLARTPELEQALLRMYRSLRRVPRRRPRS